MGKMLPDSDPRSEVMRRPAHPVQRDIPWLQYYDGLAQQIASRIAPGTVLDVGCSIGLLVEGLRRRGVAAFGVDCSASDFDQASPFVQPFLAESRFMDPFSSDHYDLIVCLHALDGDLNADETVIANLCAHTDDVLFSSGSSEAQILAPDYAGIFARLGFLRDLDFEASFFSPSTARFRRQEGVSLANALGGYERRFQQLNTEIQQLHRLTAEQAQANNRLQIEYRALNQALSARLEQWESIWADLERSAAWKFIVRVRQLRLRLAPPGSRRAAVLRLVMDSPGVLRREGLAWFFRYWGRGLRSEEVRFAVGQKTIQQLNEEAYPIYIERTKCSQDDLDLQRETVRGWQNRPLISFITPVYRPPVDVLRATIESVLAQSYEHWELCVADASLDAPEVRRLLEAYAAQDERIRVEFLDQNLGICGNSNAAIRAARGEYIAILDHDDVVSPQMLFEVVRRIQENSFADLIYFDEDKLSEDGAQRRAPFFKPDFSPEMLVSANYLTHAVYRRALVEAAGGFDPVFEGCQDWDLAFKVTERTKQVEHIPQVLYHWRQVSGSTAGDFGAKSYVFERQLKCVQDHLERTGLTGVQASFPVPGILRATWPVSGEMVSIIIPTKDKLEYLERTIETLRERTVYPSYELVVVDNGSTEPQTLRYFEKLRQRDGVRIVDYADKFNYSRANNLGAQHAGGNIFLFLNNDVEILHADWLEEMVRWMERPGIGVVGAKLLYPDETIQHAGVIVGMEGHASHVFYGYRERQSGPFGSADWYRNFTAVTGACMMVSREVFEKIGGFNEKYILAFSDIEFCLRVIDHGYRVVYTPHARLHHFEGKSRGDHIPSHDILVGVDDFLPLVEKGDPFYNPNLSYLVRRPLVRIEEEEERVARLLRLAVIARSRA